MNSLASPNREIVRPCGRAGAREINSGYLGEFGEVVVISRFCRRSPASCKRQDCVDKFARQPPTVPRKKFGFEDMLGRSTGRWLGHI